jgi:hypothetical protein
MLTVVDDGRAASVTRARWDLSVEQKLLVFFIVERLISLVLLDDVNLLRKR